MMRLLLLGGGRRATIRAYCLVLLLLLHCSKKNNHYFVVLAQQAPNPALNALAMFDYPAASTFGNNPAGTFRNNFCALSDQVLVYQNLTLDQALQGVDLHVALMQGQYVTFDKNRNTDHTTVLDPEYPGLVPRLLDELCQRAGCHWRNTYAALSYSDLPDDKVFDDLLQWSTEVYDLQGEWWMRSIDRLKAGSTFTEPWYDGTIILVAPRVEEEKDSFDPWGWLAPFDRGVWIMVVATVLFSAMVHWLLHVKLNPNADEHEAQVDPIEAMWLFATAFAGQFEFDPQTGPSRLFTFSIAFWALLMTSAYTANLASFLVIRNTPANRIESLPQAVKLDLKMCVWKASGTEEAIRKSFRSYHASDRLVRKTTEKEVFQGVRNGECQIAITEVSTWDVFQTDKDINGDCALSWIGRPYQTIPASFGVKSDAGTLCTSLLRDVFNLFLHDMATDGTIDLLWDEQISRQATVTCDAAGGTAGGGGRRLVEQKSQTNNNRNDADQENVERILRGTAAKNAASEGGGGDDEETTKLTLTNMGGVFMLHGILSILSILSAVVPWLWRSRSKSLTAQEEGHFNDPTTREGKDDDGSQVSEASLYFFDALSKPSPAGDGDNNMNGSMRSLRSGGGCGGGKANNNEAAIEALRAEMNFKLGSIEAKLAALLKQQQ